LPGQEQRRETEQRDGHVRTSACSRAKRPKTWGTAPVTTRVGRAPSVARRR
jgi:hypothetical protein